MPRKKREITEQEWEEVKNSVESAKVRSTILIKGTDSFEGEMKTKRKELLLWWVGKNSEMISMFSSPDIIRQAALDNDFLFFRKLGRKLEKMKNFLNKEGIYDQFLIDHWIDEKDGIPPLFRMPVESIMEAYRYYFKTESIDEKCLRDRIKFLYLKGINHSRIKVQINGHKLKILSS